MEFVSYNSVGNFNYYKATIDLDEVGYFKFIRVGSTNGVLSHWGAETVMVDVNELGDKKTITIIGYGKNGVGIAKRVKPAFNMKVIGVVRVKRDNVEGKEFCDEIVGFDGLNENIIGQSDFILATLPQTKQSVNLFDKTFFSKMKKNAVFINIGRGSAVVEDDLVEALNSNTIRGAVLDVTQKEPLEKTSKLYDIPKEKLLITNHSGDVTDSYVDQSYAVLLKNLKSYLTQGKKLETIVNKELGY